MARELTFGMKSGIVNVQKDAAGRGVQSQGKDFGLEGACKIGRYYRRCPEIRKEERTIKDSIISR